MDITLVLVTLLSLTLAAVMATLAWRLAREERRRSEARVAALAAEIHGDAVGRATATPRAAIHDLPLRVPGAAPRAERVDRRDAEVALGSELFGAAQPSASRSPVGAVVAVIAIVVVAAAAALFVSGRDAATTPASTSAARPAPALPAQAAATLAADPAPLELLALTHDRDADRLTVRGMIRNPAAGAEVSRLAAVVFLFNHDGGFVTSGRAAIETPSLVPGVEAPFVVTIPGAATVGRYRVSFRTDDRVVPHVDRRDRAMAQAK